MHCELRCHPDFPSAAVDGIAVNVKRDGASLLLGYRVSGRMSDIRIPPATTSSRADELWKHTCFEAFLRFEEEGYSEFNFAPSAQWAAYTFRGYREAMKPITGLASPKIATASTDISFELRATLAVDPLTALRLGLSAIIEETNGRKSYWALAHPPGKPDFHHPDCFALDLPPASPA